MTHRKPILTGRSYIRVGSILTGKIVIYPVLDRVDDEGNQLINWMAEIKHDTFEKNDWNMPGNLADFLPIYEHWQFDRLDVADLIKRADFILEYPMVDKNPIERWAFGRVTLAGDAAHPMYPRGSNGAAQAAIDARTLADCLAQHDDPRAALKAYEIARVAATAKVVRTNREYPPDFINIRVEEIVGESAVRQSRRLYHPGGAAGALGGVQTRCGILALRYQRGLSLTGPLDPLETDEYLLECCRPAAVNVAMAVNEWRPS